MQAIADSVKYKDSKGRFGVRCRWQCQRQAPPLRNISKGKVHRILKQYGLTNLDVIRKAMRKTCTFQISAYIVDLSACNAQADAVA